ncbi:hypothetical protein ILYODFUR_019194, partial [Ilyodon furcidens]
MERFRRRLDKLRTHHNNCEQRFMRGFSEQAQGKMAEKSIKWSDIHENQEGQLSESESSSCTGLDPDYKPAPSSSVSSEEEDLSPTESSSSKKRPLEDTDTSLSEDEDHQRGKCINPTIYLKKQWKQRKKNRVDKAKSSLTVDTSRRKDNCKRIWEGDLSPTKGSSSKKRLREEHLEDSDTSLNTDDHKIDEGKNPMTYVKRHFKRHKKNRVDKAKSSLTVKTCTKKDGHKRIWDKKHYCLYCGQSQSKVSRHLQRRHGDIKDVAYAFSFPLRSQERKVLLEQLRNKGDFKHNVKVIEERRGQIVTWKQPSDKASVADYLPCSYCFGMFRKTDLWRHQASCKIKDLCETDDSNVRRRVQSRAVRLLPIVASSDGCQTIINNMRQDDVSFHVRSDSLICKYGESLYAKHGRVKSRHQYISQRMRELGRFMLVAKDMDKTVKGLEDLCVPSRFQFVVDAAKRLTEFSPGKNEYGKPSTAVKIGFCLKGALEVHIGQTLINDDDLAEKKAKKFFELLEKNWKNSVSISAHATIQEKRWNKDDDIPLTKNVMALRDHLRHVEDEAKGILMDQMNLAAYKKLNETVLAQIIIFNKRREGEASRLTVETYKRASTSPVNEDIFETLSPLEKELSKLLTRIEIRGKRGRKVPVFLTERMKDSIELLLKRREEAGVLPENPYLFARSVGTANIRGCDCLRKYAVESKAENPELLRSTKLRKQVATLCQLLDLGEQELEQVARFMGHDIRVHHDFYRQTDKTFQITKISKLLFAMEQGTGSLRGKNLSTLDLSDCGEIPTPTSQSAQKKKKKQRREAGQIPTPTFQSTPKENKKQGRETEDDISVNGSDYIPVYVDEAGSDLFCSKTGPETCSEMVLD